MSAGVDEWEFVLGRLAADVNRRAQAESEWLHFVRVRKLGTPSAKLVYIFVKDHQPQTYATIRRSLGIGGNSVLRALKELLQSGYVVRDDEALYWVSSLGLD